MTDVPLDRSAQILLVHESGFVLHRRADVRDALAYPGKIGLFGGHAEPGEPLEETASRELEEETGLSGLPLELIWEGDYDGLGKSGEPKTRHVALFRCVVSHLMFDDLEGVGKVVIAPDEINSRKNDLTAFAYQALKNTLNGV